MLHSPVLSQSCTDESNRAHQIAYCWLCVGSYLCVGGRVNTLAWLIIRILIYEDGILIRFWTSRWDGSRTGRTATSTTPCWTRSLSALSLPTANYQSPSRKAFCLAHANLGKTSRGRIQYGSKVHRARWSRSGYLEHDWCSKYTCLCTSLQDACKFLCCIPHQCLTLHSCGSRLPDKAYTWTHREVFGRTAARLSGSSRRGQTKGE